MRAASPSPVQPTQAPRAGSVRPPWEAVLLALVVMVAALVRIGPVATAPETQRNGLGQFGDSQLYHRLAVNLQRGRGFSATDDGTAFGGERREVSRFEPAITRPPAYPAFLAAIYSRVGAPEDTSPGAWRKRWDAVRVVQGALDVVVVVMVFGLVRLAMPGSTWAPLAAAAVYAVSPYNVFYTRALLSEALGTFLAVAALLASALAARRGRAGAWVPAGALWGLASLCQAQLMLFPLFVAGWLLVSGATRRAGVRSALACGLGAALVIAPWTLRNVAVFGRPVPIAVGATGYQLFLGTFETKANWRGWEVLPEEIFSDARQRARIDSLVRDLYSTMNAGSPSMDGPNRELRALAMEQLRANPGRTIRAWLDGVPRLWFQDYIPMYRDREASGALLLGFLVLALYALGRAPRDERAPVVPAALLGLYLTMLFLPLHVEARYSVVAVPGVIVLAILGVRAVHQDLRRLVPDASRRLRAPGSAHG